MRAVAQRVSSAWVDVSAETVGRIERGLLVYLGAGKRDTVQSARMMAEKVATLRLFEDATGKMACDVKEASGQVLIVPQFTLYGDVRRGRRPSFADAAQPDIALQLYELVVLELRTRGLSVATGRFRAMMQVHAVVDGPVTVLIDSEKVF